MFVELVRVQAGGVDEAIVYLTYHVPTPSLHRAPMCPSRMKVTLKLEEKAATGGEIWVVKKLEQYNAC
jgi:hypothetical protein